MKKFILKILFIFFTSGLFSKNNDSTNEFMQSKKIISDFNKIVNPDGIQEDYEISIGNIKQHIYVRGQDKKNPVILFVHGGPASPISPEMWMFQKPLEEYFTIVNYDQRAAGKTYLENDTSLLGETINIQQFINDAIELTEFIKKIHSKKNYIDWT